MSKKVIIFAIVALVIAAIVWYMGSSSSETAVVPASGPLSSSGSGIIGDPVTPTDTLAAGGDFAQLLASVESISIDTSIFSSASYRALRDNKVILTPEPIGRPNPFAPIGTDQGGTVSTPDVQTVQPGKVGTTTAEFAAQVTLRDNVPVTVVFQYGTSDIFGSATISRTLTASGTMVIPVTGLMPGTTYLVKAVVVRGSIATEGSAIPFTTLGAPNSAQ